MKSVLPALFFMLCLFTANAQPGIEWQTHLGGTSDDESRFIANTADGGYFQIGRSKSVDGDIPSNQGDYDLSLMKLDASGAVTWSKSYGGTAFDGGFHGMECANGDFIVIGSTNSNDGDVSGNHGGSDLWVMRLDAGGNILWQIVYGGSGTEFGLCIHQTSDGGFIASGLSDSADGDITGAYGANDMIVLRISGEGDIIWANNIGGSGGDRGWHIIELSTGGFVLTGDSDSIDGDMPAVNQGGVDAVAVFIEDDGVGTVIGVVTFGGTGGDEARFVAEQPDGNLVFSGATLSGDGQVVNYHGGYDYWVFGADQNGNLLWGSAFGGTANEYVRFMYMASNGDVVTGGYCDSVDGDLLFSNGGSDSYVIRVNGSDGTLRWGYNFGGSLNEIPFGACVAADGGFVVTSVSNSTDFDVDNALGGNDMWVIKLENDLVDGIKDFSGMELQVFPNPAGDHIAVVLPADAFQDVQQVTLLDITGKTMVLPLESPREILDFDLSGIPNGMYWLSVQIQEKIFVAKLAVIR